MSSKKQKPVIFAIDFGVQQQALITTAVSNSPLELKLQFIQSSALQEFTGDLTSIDLVLLYLPTIPDSQNLPINKSTDQLQSTPLIIITDKIPEIIKLVDSNIIDIRTLKPLELTLKSITRELNLQHHRKLFHHSRLQAKNEHLRFEKFLKNSEDGFALIHENKYWSTNDAYKRIFNISPKEDLTHTRVTEFTFSTTEHQQEYSQQKTLNTSLAVLPNDKIVSALIQTRDGSSFVTTIFKTQCIVKNKLCTQILVHNPNAWSDIEKGFIDLRSFDHETGIYNKKFLLEAINNQFSNDKPHGFLAIILIDDFRHFRTQHSLVESDQIIIKIISLIKKLYKDHELLARSGDSVFSLFSTEHSKEEFISLCENILKVANEHLFANNEHYINLTLSIGISLINKRVTTANELVSQADEACDKASKNGGNQIHVYESISTPLTVISDEKNNVQLIQSAIEQNRLQPLYQPIVDLKEKNTENYAVLLRIIDQENNHILPNHFILTAEKNGLISQLDEWILKNTIQQIKKASLHHIKRKFFLSLSIHTYKDANFIETLISEIKLHEINPSLLVFQINYADVQSNPAALKNFISFIKEQCGAQLAFDHVGFSNITSSILDEYPVDYLKIEGAFTQKLLNNRESRQTIKDILKISQKRGIRTIMKSVEDANTLALLWNIGVDAVQGYFLQRPSDNMQFDFSLHDG